MFHPHPLILPTSEYEKSWRRPQLWEPVGRIISQRDDSHIINCVDTIRSTTLGVNFGCGLCVESSLGVFNQNALAAIDYAIFQAQV